MHMHMWLNGWSENYSKNINFDVSVKAWYVIYELFPNYVPRTPLPRKVGDHDPQLLWERRPWRRPFDE